MKQRYQCKECGCKFTVDDVFYTEEKCPNDDCQSTNIEKIEEETKV
jgi:predicted Zn-ribbon and HTH transcriptional regulator